MPLPAWAAQAGAAALQNPDVQQGIGNVLGGLGRGIGRGTQYFANEIAQPALTNVLDTLGQYGQQYLPQRVNQLGGLARQHIGGFYNAVTGQEENQPFIGPRQLSPERMLQNQYLQMLNQPYDYQQQAQQLLNQYNQYTTPQIREQFGLGGARNRALSSAHTNLLTNLGALGERSTAQRRGEIGNYLTGQQALGLNMRDLAQRGGLANQENTLRQLGLVGNYGQNQQANYLNQLTAALNAQGTFGGQGMGMPFNQIQQPAQAAGIWQMAPGLLNAGITGARAALGGL